MQIVAARRDAGRDIRVADIVRMNPLDQGTWSSALDGALTAGYNYTKASQCAAVHVHRRHQQPQRASRDVARRVDDVDP
jgi:hypothetical protein